MEVELEATVKPLAYKIKSVSRESPSQKAAHVLDTDLRSHWSSGTNTKEWILLELEEPCLLSHIRIHNKSVLEWEIAVGLSYKRKLQRELEQRDSGPRSRREFSSSAANSRPSERYRERDSGHPSQEGSLRPSSAGSGCREGATTPPPAGGTNATSAAPLVLGGSRTYAVQPPLILKSRDRTEEHAYDENFDGNRDSGDAGGIGDPDSSSVDGTSVGYGASHRHGSRSGKPRQIVERRERDGRREGKWERKHS